MDTAPRNCNHGIISLGQNKTRLLHVKSSNLRLNSACFTPLPFSHLPMLAARNTSSSQMYRYCLILFGGRKEPPLEQHWLVGGRGGKGDRIGTMSDQSCSFQFLISNPIARIYFHDCPKELFLDCGIMVEIVACSVKCSSFQGCFSQTGIFRAERNFSLSFSN